MTATEQEKTPDQPKRHRFGHPGSFLALAIAGFFISRFALQIPNRLAASCGLLGLFLAGVCPVVGLVVGLARWRHLSLTGKLATILLAFAAIWMGIALVPAL